MITFSVLCLCLVHLSNGMFWGTERGEDRCDIALKEMTQEDRATAVDDTSTRLHATWMSQECEARAGPEFVIRKYSFFKNGTFLLIRYHYAEESCTVPTHTVTATGIIELLSLSPLVPGATEARYYLGKVYITPLNRQVAYKLGHRVNVSCTHQPKWRPYEAHVIYDQAIPQRENPLWESPRHNSLEGHQMSKTRRGINCLEPTGIDFEELKLLRVQKKPYVSKIFSTSPNGRPWVELFLGSLPPNVQQRRNHKSTSLQSTALLRSDTRSGCPICGAVARSTINSPPLLHEIAPLPALIGGSWLSFNCESTDGGLWLRRQIQFYSGDKLWAARWDYFADPQCNIFLYAISGAGSYVQRAGNRQRRHYDFQDTFAEEPEFSGQRMEPLASSRLKRGIFLDRDVKSKRSLDDDSYKYLLQDAQPSMVESFTAMLRGNNRKMENVEQSVLPHPLGTTELDLHVAESLLVPGDLSVALRCGGDVIDGVRPLSIWPRSCIPKTLEAPTTLGLRAKIGVNWNGQYTLLLGIRDDNIWYAPLVQCGPASSHNPELRTHLRRSVGLRFGLLSSGASELHVTKIQTLLISIIGFLLYSLVR